MNVLVTGGAGYIGSFATQRLIDEGCKAVVFDNFSSGYREALHPKCTFVLGDIRDRELPARVMKDHKIDAVMHFAAKNIVPESVSMPLDYYENNLFGGLNLLQCCLRAGVKKFIFSSSASVYGTPQGSMVTEESLTSPANPYGFSKLYMEQILQDVHRAQGMDFISLRYFNVAGAALDGKNGQRTMNATHLIKVAAEAAAGKRPLVEIFGHDYATEDGTAIRDYIHVEDLIDAHWLSLKHLTKVSPCAEILNCGYGKGYSVLQVIDQIEKACGRPLEKKMGARRPGDVEQIIADPAKMKKLLGWEPQYDDLEIICKTAYLWEVSGAV